MMRAMSRDQRNVLEKLQVQEKALEAEKAKLLLEIDVEKEQLRLKIEAAERRHEQLTKAAQEVQDETLDVHQKIEGIRRELMGSLTVPFGAAASFFWKLAWVAVVVVGAAGVWGPLGPWISGGILGAASIGYFVRLRVLRARKIRQLALGAQPVAEVATAPAESRQRSPTAQ